MRDFLERLRTAWNTLIDSPSAHVELSFGELPPLLLTRLEAIAEWNEQPLGDACYLALCLGTDALTEQMRQEMHASVQ
jgi:hypothetical protein